MVRRSQFSKRVHLSLEQLENRWVPAGMIEVYGEVYEPSSGDESYVRLSILGDAKDNQVRVEQMCTIEWNHKDCNVQVSSASGPIRYTNNAGGGTSIIPGPIELQGRLASLSVSTGNGDDTIEVIGHMHTYAVTFVIESGNGNDQVLLDQVIGGWLPGSAQVDTGRGDDLVTLRDCEIMWHGWNISTGLGDDRVIMQGSQYGKVTVLYISLGAGDDVLEGDPDPDRHIGVIVEVYPSLGYDQLLNADYFSPFSDQSGLGSFEEIVW